MEKYETINCIICDSENLDKVTEKGQFGFPTHVCICKECGLSFLNPRWDKPTYFNFYKTEYDKYYRSENSSQKSPIPLKQSMTSYYPIIKRIERLGREKQSFDKVLDVGSGDCSQLMAFIEQKVGKEYYAIEPSVEYKAEIEKKGVKFIANDVDTDWDKSYEGYFDLIIMRHVVEHFSRPDLVLEKIKNVLSPEGVVYIAVPDSFNPQPPFTDNFIRVVHTYYFNKPSLTNLLHKSGLEIVSINEGDVYFPELFVFAKRSTKDLDLNIDKKTYEVQKEVFQHFLEEEKKVSYKIKQQILALVNLIVKIKKYFFPQPIIKRKDIC
jgi:SAM-dependent methyltransferase